MINKAVQAFKKGEIVLIFDDDNRERETDMLCSRVFMTLNIMTTIRNELVAAFACLYLQKYHINLESHSYDVWKAAMKNIRY